MTAPGFLFLFLDKMLMPPSFQMTFFLFFVGQNARCLFFDGLFLSSVYCFSSLKIDPLLPEPGYPCLFSSFFFFSRVEL